MTLNCLPHQVQSIWAHGVRRAGRGPRERWRALPAGAQPAGSSSVGRARGAHERPEPRRPAQLAAARRWRGRLSIPPLCPACGLSRASEPWAARTYRCLPSMRRAQSCVPLARRCDPRAAIRCAAPYGCGLTQLVGRDHVVHEMRQRKIRCSSPRVGQRGSFMWSRNSQGNRILFVSQVGKRRAVFSVGVLTRGDGRGRRGRL